jgi:hypothetical protein
VVARRHSGNADLDREEIKDASPSQTPTVGPRNSGAKKAPLGENVEFHSPVLIKAVEGRDAVAAIFATSASVREGRYVMKHNLDERTTFLWWTGNINGHEIESFDVLVDNDYVHGDHADEHALEVGRANPAACTPLTQGARPGAQPPRYNLTDAIESLPSGLHRPKHKEHHDIL